MLLALLLSLLLPALASAPPVTVLRIGTARIVLDSTDLDSTRLVLGATAINESGDASTGDHWLCYSVREPAYHLRLESREMNGPSIGAFWFGPAKADTARGACSAPTHALSRIRTDRGIAVGITRDSVQRVLGAPTRHRAHWDEYFYQRHDLYCTFRATYRDSVVVVIEGNVFHAD